jgi:glycine hydroxymethyltransferase
MSKSEADWYAKSSTWRPEEEVRYMENLRKSLDWGCPEAVYGRVKQLYGLHDDFREKSCVNLVASENVMSPTAKAFLGSDLGFRVCDGPVGKKIFGTGIQYLEELETICVEASRRLFKAEYVEHRLLSGTMGCAAVLYALAKNGDTVMSQSSDAGGVVCNRPEGPAGYIGLKVVDLPWDSDAMNVDSEAFEEAAKEARPRLIILGAMITLFPYPVKEIAEIAKDLGARVAYDRAHIGGLVAGGRFQDPLGEGSDLLMVNTHKQMGGPPGALILSNDEEVARKISETTFPFLVATPYCNKFAALAVTLSELMEYGAEYADQIVRNAKALAAELDILGVPVMCRSLGYTESHQVLLDVRVHGGGFEAERRLAEAHMICNKMPLPGDSWTERSGLRLGVNEVTRRGMKEKNMKDLAEFISRALVEGEQAKIGVEVADYMKSYQKVMYCFDHVSSTTQTLFSFI